MQVQEANRKGTPSHTEPSILPAIVSVLLLLLFPLQGYSSGTPGKRMNPVTSLQFIGLFGLIGTGIVAAVKLLQSK